MKNINIESPYLSQFSIPKKIRRKLILKILDCSNFGRVLDIGCGSGLFTYEISKLSNEVIGIDNSKKDIDLARGKYKNIKNLTFLYHDANNMPFEGRSFDMITATELLEHIEDDAKFLQSCFKLLKPHGTLIMTVPCTNPFISLEWLRKLMGVDMKSDFGHKRAGYTKECILNLLHSANFKQVYIKNFNQFWSELIWIFTIIPKRLLRCRSKKSYYTKLKNSFSFKIYKSIFPLLFALTKLDYPLSNLRGHQLLIRAVKNVM